MLHSKRKNCPNLYKHNRAIIKKTNISIFIQLYLPSLPVTFFPLMYTNGPWKPAFLPSFLACSTYGQSLFLASFISSERSSRILIFSCFGTAESLASFQILTHCVREISCTIMRRGETLFSRRRSSLWIFYLQNSDADQQCPGRARIKD